MPQPNPGDDHPILAVWREQLEHTRANPFLFQLLLKQYQRVLKRLAYFYAQLASLPRRNRRALQRALATSLIGAAMVLALSSAPVALANSITVSGACTLDEAITNANDDAATFPDCAGGSGADTIYLTGNVTIGVDTPAAALPDITSEITLEGSNFYVSGASAFRVFYVSSSGDFTINDTTIKDGSALLAGGGIANYSGTLELNDSTVSGNTAAGAGGGIINTSGTVTLTDSTVSGNTAAGAGGGIINTSGTVTLTDTTVSGNTAAGRGGGIISSFGTLMLTNSAVSGNDAPLGGGILSYIGVVVLTNSTISGNTAADDGGGIYNYLGTLTLNNCTVSGNLSERDGGGIYNQGSITLRRTLISGNTAPSEGNEIYNGGSISANDYNLFGYNGETNAQAFYNFTPGASDITATSDGTTPTALASILDTTLALNGGTTENHALVSGSPALDRAPNAACTASPINDIDQRGFPRNVDIVPPPTANDCDIGSFELQLSTAVNVTGLRAIAKEDKNVLKWRTTTETQIAGFNVWRRNGQGEWKQINANLKQAKHSGDAQGDKYSFRDKKVKDGNTYRYKIEVKYLDGHDEWTEVVRVRVP